MTAPQSTALAILQDGTRIPLSEPVKRARELFADRQYDADVVGIEHSGEATDTQTVVSSWPAATEQLALL